VPLVAREPDHPAPAVQASALVALQLSCTVEPLATEVADAWKLRVGASGASTVTCTSSLALPPGPVQLML